MRWDNFADLSCCIYLFTIIKCCICNFIKLSIGIGYLIFYYFLSGVFYASIFMTFSVSILLIELLDQVKAYAFSDFKPYKLALAALAFAVAVACAYLLFEYVSFDYGFFGMMVPVLVGNSALVPSIPIRSPAR